MPVFIDLKGKERRPLTIGGARYAPQQKALMRNIAVALAVLSLAHLALYRRAARQLGFRR
jgi:hypothetical protein